MRSWVWIMKRADSFKQFVLDQLESLGGLRCRGLFGGYGLYREDAFFGIIFKSRLYFKTDATSRSAYVERDTQPFRPNPKQELQTYYEVPIEILEDREQLFQWATEAVRASASGKRLKAASGKR